MAELFRSTNSLRLFAAAVAFALIAILGCALPATVTRIDAVVAHADAYTYRMSPRDEAMIPTIAQRENDFGFSLLRSVDDHSGNVFISPISVGQAMTMLCDGARGETRTQIAGAMNFAGLGAADVDGASFGLRNAVTGADSSVDLSVANALWADRSVDFRPTYADRCLSIFDAPSTTLDFNSPSAASIINSWVSQNTKGKITSILAPGPIFGAGAVLTDAVYFHGSWSNKFDPQATESAPFTGSAGTSIQLPMMHQTTDFAVMQNNIFQAVKLPYGNGRISMVIVLPRAGVPLESLSYGLTSDEWRTWLSSMSEYPVDLTLPKFHIDYSTSLASGLKTMGIRDAFGPGAADFEPMSDTAMYVSDVLHKTTLDVDETDTTATAATAIVMAQSCAAPSPPIAPIVIRVDHPFLCAIQDNTTGALLFVGYIRDPQAM